MTEFVQAIIKLPNSMREEVEKLAQRMGVSQEAVILQLLEFALSRSLEKQIGEGKSPLDSKNDDA